MSWSAQYETNMREPENMIVLKSSSGIDSDESKQQHDAAIHAMSDIVLNGSLGAFGKYNYTINLSGHANPEHAPREGWANDSITIMITQKETL